MIKLCCPSTDSGERVAEQPLNFKRGLMKKLIEGAGKLGIEFNARQVKQFELYYQEP